MNNKEYKQYHSYLEKRSKIGLLYRNYWLYPIISRRLKGKTLDIGCGIGDFICYRKGAIGVDINPSSVEYCLNRGLSARHMKLDILPFDDSEFESILLDNVVEHIESPNPLLKEVHRVLNKNGVLIIGVPGKKGFTSDSDHKIYYDEGLLIETLDKAGFSWVKTYRMPLPFRFLSTRIRAYCLYCVFTR
jgi:SAM-dependent methyltransferase